MFKKYADHVRGEEEKFTVMSQCMDQLEACNVPENHTAVAGSDSERTITDLSDTSYTASECSDSERTVTDTSDSE